MRANGNDECAMNMSDRNETCLIRSCCAAIYLELPPRWRGAASCSTCSALPRWKSSARARKSRRTGCAPSATPTPRRSGFAKSKGEDASRACWQPGESLGQELQGSSSGSKSFRRSSPICSWVCRIFCTPASPKDSTRAPMSRCAAGACRDEFAFEPKDHVALGERFGMDFEAAGRISGARFVVMTRHAGQAAPRAGAIHAGPARARSWLSRGLRALPGARRRRWSAPGNCRNSSRINSRCAAIRAST